MVRLDNIVILFKLVASGFKIEEIQEAAKKISEKDSPPNIRKNNNAKK